MGLHLHNEFDDRLRARLEQLEIPECQCPVFGSCPECGAVDGQDCVVACLVCEAEWPQAERGKGLAARCPCCALPQTLIVMEAGRNGQWRLRGMRMAVECPRAHKPRPVLPACEHILAAAHDTPLEEWQSLLWLYDYHAYRDRPEPAEPITNVLPGPAKAEQLSEREANDEGFWHPADVGFDQLPDQGRKGARFDNGAKASPRLRVEAQTAEGGKEAA